MKGARRCYGTRFRDIQHGGNFFNPLDLKIDFTSDNGIRTELVSQLSQVGELASDSPPVLQESILNGQPNPALDMVRGLLPDIEAAESIRPEARKLLDMSCHLQPVRDPIRSSYTIQPNAQTALPETDESVAQMLRADSELRAAVGAWTVQNLDGWRLDLKQNLDVFHLTTRRGGREGNLADAGQGIQQVLPVVALCCWRKLGRGGQQFLDIIEQPELHLHDAAHAPLGDLLLSAVSDRQGSILVETHSESLVLRVRRRVAEGLIGPDQVAIMYVEDTGDGSRLRQIHLDSDGEVEWWPEGVFSESFLEVKAIRRAQRKKTET